MVEVDVFGFLRGQAEKMFVLHDKALETRYRKEPYVEQTRVLFADILFSLLPHYKRSLNESEREAIFMEKIALFGTGPFFKNTTGGVISPPPPPPLALIMPPGNVQTWFPINTSEGTKD